MKLLLENGAAPFSDNCSTLLNIPLKQNEKRPGRSSAGSFSLRAALKKSIFAASFGIASQFRGQNMFGGGIIETGKKEKRQKK